MIIPRLYFGRLDVAALLRTHAGYDDDGAYYDVLARTNRVPPAGIGGEAAFFAVYVSLVYGNAETPILVTAIIDEMRQPTRTYVLPASGERTSIVLEVPLLVQFPDTVPGFATRGLFAPRGCWFQIEVATAFVTDTVFVQVDAVEVEIEVVQEGRHELITGGG